MTTRVLALIFRALHRVLTPARLERMYRAEMERQRQFWVPRKLETEVPQIGTVPAKIYADRVAEAYLEWLALEGMVEFGAASEQLAKVAEERFAVETGIELPPMRQLLGALKRHPRIHIIKHFRVRDDDGKLRKVTFYMSSPAAQPQSSSSPGETREAA